MRAVVGFALVCVALLFVTPTAFAQDFDEIVSELERNGYYIENGAFGSDADFEELVRRAAQADDKWYFVSLTDTVGEDYADQLRDTVSPTGNVLLYFFDGDADNVQLASSASESVEERALDAFSDDGWVNPDEFMGQVVSDFDAIQAPASSGSSSSNSSGSDAGGGFPWALLAIPVLLGGGIWFMSSRSKKKRRDGDLETAQKIRAELQTEIDELANDVLVLSGPVDVADKPQAIEYYREATDTYLDIADEIPDIDELEHADLPELAEYGTRVAHARWQMDAADALISGEPVPEKPKVTPPPAPQRPPEQQRTPQQRQQRMPQRAPRPRVPYSPSRRRSGGGLLDILIAGAGMMGGRSSGRRSSGGGMFGGSSRGSRRTSSSSPRPGGGVFGGSSRGRSSSRSSGRSTSRRSSNRSSGRRSTSRRRNRRSSRSHRPR